MRNPAPDPCRTLPTHPTVAVAMAEETRSRPKLSDDLSFSVYRLVLGSSAAAL
jgi:hypothetical protein